MTKKYYDEGSILDLAVKGFSNIKKLAESSLISDKLSAINMILFLLIFGIIISFYLSPSREDMFTFFFVLAISLLFSCISLLFYGPFLEIIAKHLCKNKIEGLRVSINVLFIDITIVISGLLFNIELLIKISLMILGFQILLLIIFSYISITKITVKDKESKPFDLWDSLGKLSSIIGIINFIVDLILIIIKI